MSQVHYFVIIINQKSQAFSRSHFQECENWILHLKVNFHDGITQISLSLFHPFSSIHLSVILLHLDASLHLPWFTLFIWRHLFSRSTARLMFFHFALLCCSRPTYLCVCMCCLFVCVCVCIYKYLVQALLMVKKPLKAITTLKFNAFGQCSFMIRRGSYLFIFLSIH